ncbi:hypothetical protein [Luteimicrobium subarcticum]|uniref:Uncharacterized protein n=1 Tax=Luteimicrobium subarcticum TaxID=620910 RepID=A0A2M8WJL6_9MICO|nr:hypothetical protein [Luteimicrobium subarcticum]PJI91088.1 hypothetical protein CLV34_2352 [Luteimicrobium subarcticum]
MTVMAPVACADCAEPLRAEEDVLCRWCDDNRTRRPEDYEAPARVWADRAHEEPADASEKASRDAPARAAS